MGSIEWMTGEALVRAEVRLLPTADGGKSCAISGSYRPNHNFFDAENRDMAIGLIEFTRGETMSPGESRVLEITFLSWPKSELRAGREWRIQEGAQLVGTGKILEVQSGGPSQP